MAGLLEEHGWWLEPASKIVFSVTLYAINSKKQGWSSEGTSLYGYYFFSDESFVD